MFAGTVKLIVHVLALEQALPPVVAVVFPVRAVLALVFISVIVPEVKFASPMVVVCDIWVWFWRRTSTVNVTFVFLLVLSTMCIFAVWPVLIVVTVALSLSVMFTFIVRFKILWG